jgi:hypothetical protein
MNRLIAIIAFASILILAAPVTRAVQVEPVWSSLPRLAPFWSMSASALPSDNIAHLDGLATIGR